MASVGRYARSPLVRNYLSKVAQRQKPLNVSKWYDIDTDLLPEHIKEKFELSTFDAGTEEFIENCYEKSDWVFTQIFHSAARLLFSFFMSMTSVNGLLSRGSMFVFSEPRFRTFINIQKDWKAPSLLDLGAGDGKVTESILCHFDKVYATEQSPTMRWRLKEKGFKVLEIDNWANQTYSLITALNLLDRINQPIKLLHELHSALKVDEGLVVVAIVLPYKPCYETGVSFTDPIERLPVYGRTIEDQIKSLHDDVFAPNGFEVVKFTRLPYLCEGDIHNDFFVLTDILFLLKPIDMKLVQPTHDSYCPASLNTAHS